MVAHEVRNPLQSLSLLATLARTETDDKEREALLTSIETEIHVLEGVVQRFLRSSGPLQISRSASDLVEQVHKAMGVASPQARNRQVNLELIAPPRLPMTLDPSLVRRALENLMLNAIEFSGAEPPGAVRIEIARTGRAVTITVDDNGPGVPANERDRVFKPYYSSKAGGTGLGLALVKQVFQAHGGDVRCEDSPLGGARFSATLPIDETREVPFAG
jgi:signal transduction histidine kinase